MTHRQAIIRRLVCAGDETLSRIPEVSALPRGREAIIASFVVDNPAMAEMAAQAGLDAAAVLGMVAGRSWGGTRLKPIEAALLAPAFAPAEQREIAAALESAQRAFWEGQHFYLVEMAAAQAGDIPNALMRETSLAMEDRAVAYLRRRLEETTREPVPWVDYAAGPASFVNGTLQRLQREGLDVGGVRVVLVEPARRFREFAARQPALRELGECGRLRFVDGVLEDGETYERVRGALQSMGASKADVVTQAFGASYVADHLRPAMWKAMLGTGKPGALRMVVATTDKYNPSRMVFDRLRDEVSGHVRQARNGRSGVAVVPAFFSGLWAWAHAFARPVPVDAAGNKRPSLVALIRYGQGVKDYCPTRRSGEAFAAEIEQATCEEVQEITPVLDGQAVLIRL